MGVKIPLSLIKWSAVLALGWWGLWLFNLWQPVRQVELHTENLLKRVSSRDWPAVLEIVSDDYEDAWGHNREDVIGDAQTLLSHFFALQVVALEPPVIRVLGGEGSAAVRVGVFGSGTAVAHAVMDAVREVDEPFVFRWKKGDRPWRWRLVEIRHEALAARYPQGAVRSHW